MKKLCYIVTESFGLNDENMRGEFIRERINKYLRGKIKATDGACTAREFEP